MVAFAHDAWLECNWPVFNDALNLPGKATPGASLPCLGLVMSSVQLKLSREVWTSPDLKLFLHPV